MDPHASRYAKQILFHGIGAEGQSRLAHASVLVAGCGALGTALVEGLVRAGVGRIRLVDRDYVELSNLQRQVLFDEDDVTGGLPKAVAAARKLRRINQDVSVEPLVTDIGPDNVLDLFQGVDLVLDGLDNFETRFLLNDASLETGIPWIYAGCLGAHGQTMPIIPQKTACLRCLIESPPDPGTADTCDTAGIIQPILSAITALQLVNAFKLLVGRIDEIEQVLTLVDVWDNSHRKLKLGTAEERQFCPACGLGQRDWLNGERLARSSILCGRNAVQISPAERLRLSLDELAVRLAPVGPILQNAFLLRLEPAGTDFQLTLFPDGRAIIKGTEDPAVARSVYARYVGT
jgi:molybdopterin/thiamine biosynthesis adenylyltransferase